MENISRRSMVKVGLTAAAGALLGATILRPAGISFAEETYKDGTYTAIGKGIGGNVPVTVTIEDGAVASVEVGENNETQGVGSKAIDQLPDEIVAANGHTELVDGVSGASVTSQAIFDAVDDCLEQARGTRTSNRSDTSDNSAANGDTYLIENGFFYLSPEEFVKQFIDNYNAIDSDSRTSGSQGYRVHFNSDGTFYYTIGIDGKYEETMFFMNDLTGNFGVAKNIEDLYGFTGEHNFNTDTQFSFDRVGIVGTSSRDVLAQINEALIKTCNPDSDTDDIKSIVSDLWDRRIKDGDFDDEVDSALIKASGIKYKDWTYLSGGNYYTYAVITQ